MRILGILFALGLSFLLPSLALAQGAYGPGACEQETTRVCLPTGAPAMPIEGEVAEGVSAAATNPVISGSEARALGALPAAVDPGDAIRVRSSLSGITYMTFVDPTGSFVYGAAATPLRIDPTGTTPQPASQSGVWSVRIQDGGGTAVTSQAAGGQRPLDVQILTAAGAAMGAAGTPIRVDPTGTTRQPVDPIAGQIGVAAGAGASDALTQRVILETGQGTNLQTIAGWDVGAGAASATTLQCIAPTDDPGVTLLGTIDADTATMSAWDETGRAAVNLVAGQTGVAAGAGAAAANTLQCIAPTDGPDVVLLGTIDADTASIATDASTIAGDTTSLDGKTPALGTALVVASSPVTIATDDVVSTGVTTIAGDTTSIDGKTPTLGTALMAASSPATIATDDLLVTNSTAIEGHVSTIDTSTATIAGDTTSIDGKTPALGTALMAASSPVTIATDDVVSTGVTTVAGDTTSIDGKIPALGTALIAASSPVTIATDDVVSTGTTTIAGDTTSIDGKTPALGAALMAASSPVTVATDDLLVTNSTAIEGHVSTVDTSTATIAGDTTSIDGKVPALGTATMPNASPVTIATDDVVSIATLALSLAAEATGALAAPTNALQIGGFDGVNFTPIAADSSGNLYVYDSALSAQLPAALGATTSALSLSIAPATDAYFPVYILDSSGGTLNGDGSGALETTPYYAGTAADLAPGTGGTATQRVALDSASVIASITGAVTVTDGLDVDLELAGTAVSANGGANDGGTPRMVEATRAAGTPCARVEVLDDAETVVLAADADRRYLLIHIEYGELDGPVRCNFGAASTDGFQLVGAPDATHTGDSVGFEHMGAALACRSEDAGSDHVFVRVCVY
jgi:hypothetical protein